MHLKAMILDGEFIAEIASGPSACTLEQILKHWYVPRFRYAVGCLGRETNREPEISVDEHWELVRTTRDYAY